jgi:nitronate monooxygenase
MTSSLVSVLGIDVPILQSGMGGVAGPELAAAVANAGGLGTLAALRLTPDQIRRSVGKIRAATDRPFAMNLWLHAELLHPAEPEEVGSDILGEIDSVLNEVRTELGLERRTTRAPANGVHPNDAIEVMLELRVPVFCAAIGLASAELVDRCHSAGTVVVNMVATVDDASQAVANGVDVVVAQGSEAGGHRSYGSKRQRIDASGTGSMALIPAVVDAIGEQVPVVAAGGIVDGRGLAAAMMLGAQGVLLGTRFVATKESTASELWKRQLVEASGPPKLTDAFTGQWAKTLPATFADRYAEANAPTLPGLMQSVAAADIFAAAKAAEDPDHQPLYAGDAVPLIADLPGAGDAVASIVAEAEQALGRPLLTEAG